VLGVERVYLVSMVGCEEGVEKEECVLHNECLEAQNICANRVIQEAR
jgi:hypothetical protein